VNAAFSEWLAAELLRRSWRQKDLAATVGVTQQTASRWLLGQTVPSGVHALALARALDVSVEKVVTRLDQPNSGGAESPSRDLEIEALRARVAHLEAQLRRQA
jgi:transcriptional regulator with XRE-family HTH domain